MNGDQAMRAHSAGLPAPTFANTAWVRPVPLASATVAIVTSAALHTPDDDRFAAGDTSFRLIDQARRDLVLGHWGKRPTKQRCARNISVDGYRSAEGLVFRAWVGPARRLIDTANWHVANRGQVRREIAHFGCHARIHQDQRLQAISPHGYVIRVEGRWRRVPQEHERRAFEQPGTVFRYALLAGALSTAVSATCGVTILALSTQSFLVFFLRFPLQQLDNKLLLLVAVVCLNSIGRRRNEKALQSKAS